MNGMRDDNFLVMAIKDAYFIASPLHAHNLSCFPMQIRPIQTLLVCRLRKQHDLVALLKLLEKPREAYLSFSAIVLCELRP